MTNNGCGTQSIGSPPLKKTFLWEKGWEWGVVQVSGGCNEDREVLQPGALRAMPGCTAGWIERVTGSVPPELPREKITGRASSGWQATLESGLSIKALSGLIPTQLKMSEVFNAFLLNNSSNENCIIMFRIKRKKWGWRRWCLSRSM